MMKALIFNSGLGKRMGELTRQHHKSMARLSNGETIFGRQLRLLAAAGVTDFVITTGPFAEQLRAETEKPHLAGLNFTFVANPDYDTTNYIYSMYLARKHLDSDLLMLHGDLVFNAGAIAELIADKRPDLGMVDKQQPQPEKDFKARVVRDVIREVSVSISNADCHAFQPLYKLSRRAVKVWLDRVVAFVESDNKGVYAENALNEVAEEASIGAFSYSGHSVGEVDTPEDLARVSAQVRLFDFAEQPVLSEPDDYTRIPDLLTSARARKPLLVGGQSFEGSFIKPFLEKSGVDFVRFSGYSANPKLEEVKAGLAVYAAEGCDSIISLGGGSALDVAKCIKLLAASDSDEFPEFGAPLRHTIPHLAIPTTAGTGSESTHFAVVYIDGEKHSIAHDASVPEWVLLEPKLLESLPEYHKQASLMDALAQCVESSWAASATEQSIRYAMAGIELILDHFFEYFRKDGFNEDATRHMLRASNLGGKAINLTKTTAPHAMSYKMTSLYGTAHGHAAVLCLVGVWRYFTKLVDDGNAKAVAVAPALDRLAKAFGVNNSKAAAAKLELMLEFLRLASPELGDRSHLDDLVASVNTERLSNSPVALTPDELRHIYEYVFELRPAPYPDAELEAAAALAPATPARERHENIVALQAYEMQILQAFDAFCNEHDLQYYLSEGTMLGAIRHGGLIPWDDDIDVMMPRAEFDRFIEYARQGVLPTRYNLDSFATHPKHWVLGAKLQLTEPTQFHLPDVTELASYDGPYIDIFPVDFVTKTSGPRYALQKLMIRGLRRLLFMSSGRSRDLRRKPLVRLPLYLVSRLTSTRRVHKWIVWAQSAFNSSPDAASMANLCTYYDIDKEVFPCEWFGAGKRVSFEGQSLVVPLEAERMLTCIYGHEYNKVPNMTIRNIRSHSFASKH
jgi:alcohol dehydrogenase class IV/choline kinase/phosphorylcholine metabolism protein LicD